MISLSFKNWLRHQESILKEAPDSIKPKPSQKKRLQQVRSVQLQPSVRKSRVYT